MAIVRATVLALAAMLLGVVLLSGGFDDGPATPPALPGQPPPFLGTAVIGTGGPSGAVDAYGDVVDLRAAPGAPSLIENPSDRQAAGTVPGTTGIVPRVAIDGGAARPLWQADSVRQGYEPGTNVVRTVARFGPVRVTVRTGIGSVALAMTVAARAPAGVKARPEVGVNVEGTARCRSERRHRGDVELICGTEGRVPPFPVRTAFEFAVAGPRFHLERARPLGPGAPPWARAMYRRSLLVLFALTGENGAVAAGARDGWAYVWPRDAATAALAYEAAGLGPEARRVALFLNRLPLAAAARFTSRGEPVPGRGPQGDAAGWVAAANRAAGLRSAPSSQGGATPARAETRTDENVWRDRPDYYEGAPGDYLGNALAASGIDGPKSARIGGYPARRPPASLAPFATPRGLVRVAGDPASGLDSAAAWAVRPFATPALYPAARRTLVTLLRDGTRFGITPGEGWRGGVDPWSAPTAAVAWALAALGERGAALQALADLRRAATPAGDLPERVDARTGIPTSTTPLVWSHAFTILTLRQLWP